MNFKAKLLALLISVAVNAAALATVHASMGQITEREQVALRAADQDRVPGQRPAIAVAAARQCPPAGVL
jgi:hypothetical protein